MARQKISKSSEQLLNRKYYGTDEPISVKTISDQIRAFTWYHNMKEPEDARKYLKDYFTDKNFHKIIDAIPENKIPLSSAWLCRIAFNSKRELDPNEWVRVNNSIQDAVGYYDTEEKVESVTNRPSIQDRVKDRIAEIIGDVEAIIDRGEIVDFYDWLKSNSIPAAHASKIADFYKPLRDEYYNAFMTDNEGYERFTKNQIKNKLGYIHKLIEECERFAGNIKKTRKPRKKKTMSTERALKYFKYQKSSDEFKLTSVNPASILGAQELWTFNTRYNILCVYRAEGPNGLAIRRTSIESYNKKLSIGKRLGKRTEKALKIVLYGGKVSMRKLMDDIKSTAVDLNGRSNENTIILKVVK